MRENIGLYRGKCKEINCWNYGFLGRCDNEYTIEDMDGAGNFVYPETICEYSGVDDKHGINLFEGDLVEARLCEGNWQGFSWGVQKVVFKNGAFGLLDSREDFTPFANFADRVEFIKKGTVFD